MAIRVPPGGSSLGSFLFTTSALAFGGPRSQIFNGWAPDVALDIDFTTGTLDSRITFTRASTATYYNSLGLVASAASGAPRFDYDPVTLAPRGLLLEEQRTNVVLQSSAFTVAPWAIYNSTSFGVIYLGSATAPDGTATAASYSVDRAAPADYCEIYQTLSTTAAVYTASLWLKANTVGDVGRQITLTLNNGATLFNPTLVTLTNTWVRYTCTGMTLGGDSIVFGYIGGSGSGTGHVEFQVWGAQVELGSFATSYIPTTTAAVTRSADTAEITGANFSSWYNASAGTFVAEYRPQSVSSTQPVISVNDTTANEAIRLYGSGTDPKAIVVDGGATQADLDAGTITAANASFYKLGLAFTLNDFAACFEGGTVATDVAGTLPTVTQLQLHTDIAGNVANLHIKRLQFFNTRKTDSELQGLTAPVAVGAGALVAQAAVAASTTGISGSLITDTTINAAAAVLASTTGVSGSLITDTTINAGAAVVASTTGVSRSIAPSVALTAQAAAVASTTGVSRSIAPSVALAPQRSVVSGLGGAGTTLVGTGVVTTRPALVAGVGLTASAGVGALQVSVATIDAHGVSAWIATAANLNADLADIDGLGEIPYNTVVSGPYAQVGDLWEGAAVWGKIAGKWRRLRLWTKAADAWGIAAWDQATQEFDVWSLPAYGVLDARGAHIAGSGFIRDQIWGAGDLVAGPALVTDSSSLSGLSVTTHAAWEPTPAWVKVNGKWRRATMWTNVSEEWKRVA